MRDWESHVDRQIRKLIEEGHMSNLPGEGKPLKPAYDPNTPEDLRLAYRLLADNDLAPDWIVMGRELETRHAQILADLRRAVEAYHQRTDTARQANSNWQASLRRLATAVESFNKQVLTYNLKVPTGVTHRSPINLQRETRRLLEGR